MKQFHVDKRQWLNVDDQPTLTYYFELKDGRRGQSETALQIFDLLAHPNYSDIDERETQIMVLATMLIDIAAAEFSVEGIRAKVYSGLGLFYDNTRKIYEDEIEEEGAVRFTNSPVVVLDFWNEWTCIASLIKAGYLKLFEKAYLIPEEIREIKAENLEIFEGIYGEALAEEIEYRQVTAELFRKEPTWIPNYVEIANRNSGYDTEYDTE